MFETVGAFGACCPAGGGDASAVGGMTGAAPSNSAMCQVCYRTVFSVSGVADGGEQNGGELELAARGRSVTECAGPRRVESARLSDAAFESRSHRPPTFSGR